MKHKLEPKVVVHWQPVAGEPSPLWRRLFEKLLADKPRQVLQAPAQDALTAGDEGSDSREQG